ncbi:MAG: DUF1080 domain-containing protein [Planctomycetota bacterium]|nr:DUF1080 domain-containing protein [Planctomycetota bacterium]
MLNTPSTPISLSRFLCCLLFTSVVSPITAKETLPAFTDVATAGADYLVQGEYVGKVGQAPDARPIAAQVIALGEGKFEGILYDGGLPGAGWNEKVRFHFKGQRTEDVTKIVGIFGEKLMFENPNLTGTIRDGEFRGTAEMFRNRVSSPEFVLHRISRESPTLGARPPQNAIVLFDGTNTDEWKDGKIIEDRLLNVGTETKRQFGSLHLHLEFRTPFMPTGQGMSRGNSGVYFMSNWEVQVIDSFGWNTENRKFERLSDFGRCAGIHEVAKPMVNMCFPPLTWQTYDIDYAAAKFDAAGKRLAPAMITVVHNGVLVHDRFVLPPIEPGDKENKPLEGNRGTILLQQHGNPVRYRNIWLVPSDE